METPEKLLDRISYPEDLKKLKEDKLQQVCSEIREFIIEEISHNPGHLGSSLGAVELAVAIHYVFKTPHDKVIWDVGHQAYAHKILTGRKEGHSEGEQSRCEWRRLGLAQAECDDRSHQPELNHYHPGASPS